MPNGTAVDIVVGDFLEHYGVKGMKWGVRKAEDSGSGGMSRRETKKVAKADKKWSKQLNSPRTFVKVHNAMAEEANRTVIPRINSKKEYAGDLTKNPKLQKKYEKEFETEMNKVLDRISREMLGTNASGTQRFELVYNMDTGFPKARIVDVKQARHAEDETTSVTLVWDSTGHVVDVKLPSTLSQADFNDNFLKHYGVKGMKWGVRRKRTPTKVQVATRPGKRVQTSGGKYQKTSNDAVRAAIIKQKASKSTTDSLSNKQLQEAINRMNLERQFNQLAGEHASVGRQLAQAILSQVGPKEASAIGTATAAVTGNPAAGFAAGTAAAMLGTKKAQQKSKKK